MLGQFCISLQSACQVMFISSCSLYEILNICHFITIGKELHHMTNLFPLFKKYHFTCCRKGYVERLTKKKLTRTQNENTHRGHTLRTHIEDTH